MASSETDRKEERPACEICILFSLLLSAAKNTSDADQSKELSEGKHQLLDLPLPSSARQPPNKSILVRRPILRDRDSRGVLLNSPATDTQNKRASRRLHMCKTHRQKNRIVPAN